MNRRGLTVAVLACLAGAGLALFAATRTWAVEVATRPAPLPAQRTPHTGASLLPWLPALTVVAMAGAGALPATGRAARAAVAVVLLLAGLGIAAGGGYGLAGAVPRGRTRGGGRRWVRRSSRSPLAAHGYPVRASAPDSGAGRTGVGNRAVGRAGPRRGSDGRPR